MAKPKSRKKRKKKLPTCRPAKRRKPPKKRARRSTAVDAQAAAAKRRRSRKRRCVTPKKKKARKPLPKGLHPAAAVPATPPGAGGPLAPVPDPPAPPRLEVIQSPIAVYGGPFGRAQAERLLWRAGFGPRPGQAEELAALDLEQAVLTLTRPSGAAPMDGPEPTDDGQPLDPYDHYAHDILFWLDRMVRSRHQLVERLALNFHDWFATSNDAVGSNRFMLEQTNLFRAHGLGRFSELVRAITQDPAMILFLDQASNRRGAINENYARELMELFTLGADRGAYTEDDVRELARSLSGWTYSWSDALGAHDFRWSQANRWDSGVKTVFGTSGQFTWEDACRMVVEHPMHASYFVRKLWSYFLPGAPAEGTAAKLEQLYSSSGHQIRPVVEAILCSPELYEGPRMVKPPMVLVAGMMRARGRGVTDERWSWVCAGAGQRVYYPPDVAGWDEQRWMDTNTMLGRWEAVRSCLEGDTVAPDAQNHPLESAEEAVAAARSFWGGPQLSDACVGELVSFARGCVGVLPSSRQRAQRQNALRQLIASCPDYQTA